MITIDLLGGFQLRRDGVPINVRTRKARALIAYLAMEQGRLHERQQLAALFWEDQDERSARQNLRQTLLYIREALGEDASSLLRIDGDFAIGWTAAAWIDALQLRSIRADADTDTVRSVLASYKGEFLAGLEVGGEGFDSWVVVQRSATRDIASRLCHGQLGLACVPDENALSIARFGAELDPYDEFCHRHVLKECCARGQRATALDYFRQLCERLQNEMGVGPEEETVRLAQSLLGERALGRTESPVHVGSSFACNAALLEAAFVLEQLPGSILVADLSGCVIGWNEAMCRLTGFSKRDLLGKPLDALHKGPSNVLTAKGITAQTLRCGRWVGSISHVAPNGARVSRRQVTPILDHARHPIGTVSVEAAMPG